jgi:hypothetical protein
MLFSSRARARVIGPYVITGIVEEVGVVVESTGVMSSSPDMHDECLCF